MMPDIGSGSGVLSIAAAILGAKQVVCVDVDEESVAASCDNILRNKVTDRVIARKGTAGKVSGYWPLVVANIELSVFKAEARDIAKLVASHGEVLISGLLSHQVEECLKLFDGFSVVEKIEDQGWVALALRRVKC